eukprot:522831-Prorocentrum_minimum.AAC.4
MSTTRLPACSDWKGPAAAVRPSSAHCQSSGSACKSGPPARRGSPAPAERPGASRWAAPAAATLQAVSQ